MSQSQMTWRLSQWILHIPPGVHVLKENPHISTTPKSDMPRGLFGVKFFQVWSVWEVRVLIYNWDIWRNHVVLQLVVLCCTMLKSVFIVVVELSAVPYQATPSSACPPLPSSLPSSLPSQHKYHSQLWSLPQTSLEIDIQTSPVSYPGSCHPHHLSADWWSPK